MPGSKASFLHGGTGFLSSSILRSLALVQVTSVIVTNLHASESGLISTSKHSIRLLEDDKGQPLDHMKTRERLSIPDIKMT